MTLEKFGYNEKYLTKNGRPWFPIMGEFHYSRYPKQFWKESIYKMKAGGVDVVSTYTFWIHHEEVEGEYDFSGNRDLRAFVETVKECNVYMFLRIGPWCHGEVRNGGFPDWLLRLGNKVRTNDKDYLTQVEKFYRKIYEQVNGLFLKDGGPIIGIQIENEYGHVGGQTGPEGEKHMETLAQMAKDIGFDVPYYTATGWGGAVTGGLIPVMGGYCDAPWDPRCTEIEPSGNYIFTHERNDHNIGSDHGFGAGITFDINKFPYLTAELGGGLQVTHHRRPVAKGEDIGAMSMVKLGSGVNLLGYYMYHGGTNPKGKLTTLQESKATGYPNDLPELNYDFHGPIREYGQISDNYKEIKLLAMFIKDFGEDICKMPAVIMEDNPLYPQNLQDLRYSYRHNGKSGYVFINNYQRGHKMADHQNVVFEVSLDKETINLPPIDVIDKDFYFYPFNMQLGDVLLKTALATPLCKIENNDECTYVFYTDKEPKYEVEGKSEHVKIITLTKSEAMNAWKVKLNKTHLIITDDLVLDTDEGIQIKGRGDSFLWVYPELPNVPEGYNLRGSWNSFTGYERKRYGSAKVTYSELNVSEDIKTYEILIETPAGVEDCFIQIDYDGDRAELLLDGEKIADHFYIGQIWEVGLKRFNFPSKLTLRVYSLDEDAKIYLETWPPMENHKACKLNSVTAEVSHSDLLIIPDVK